VRSRTCAAAHHWARELCKHESDLGDLSSKLELSDILQHRQKALIAAVPFVSCWPFSDLAQTVEVSMKLFSFWRSLATYRVRIALNLKRYRTRWWT
jgi:hypothetical protein